MLVGSFTMFRPRGGGKPPPYDTEQRCCNPVGRDALGATCANLSKHPTHVKTEPPDCHTVGRGLAPAVARPSGGHHLIAPIGKELRLWEVNGSPPPPRCWVHRPPFEQRAVKRNTFRSVGRDASARRCPIVGRALFDCPHRVGITFAEGNRHPPPPRRWAHRPPLPLALHYSFFIIHYSLN